MDFLLYISTTVGLHNMGTLWHLVEVSHVILGPLLILASHPENNKDVCIANLHKNLTLQRGKHSAQRTQSAFARTVDQHGDRETKVLGASAHVQRAREPPARHLAAGEDLPREVRAFLARFGCLQVVVGVHPLCVVLFLPPLLCSSLEYEIVIVEDNSPDGTLQVAVDLQKIYGKDRIVILPRKGKLGLGSAYRDGLKMATGTYVFLMDADLSHHVR